MKLVNIIGSFHFKLIFKESFHTLYFILNNPTSTIAWSQQMNLLNCFAHNGTYYIHSVPQAISQLTLLQLTAVFNNMVFPDIATILLFP